MKSIFITGAAAGIGRAIAQRFHSQGWFVGLFDIDEAGVNALASELGTILFPVFLMSQMLMLGINN